jgi:hypothetical protein
MPGDIIMPVIVQPVNNENQYKIVSEGNIHFNHFTGEEVDLGHAERVSIEQLEMQKQGLLEQIEKIDEKLAAIGGSNG